MSRWVTGPGRLIKRGAGLRTYSSPDFELLLGLVGLVQLYVSSTSDSCELFAPGLTDLEQVGRR
eukprot:4184055-Pleurochrysis_carterae.AAC.1